MVLASGLDIYLARQADIAHRYPEHVVPVTSPKYSGDRNEAYIEAIDDERFAIVVDLTKGFDFAGATHIRIGLSFQGRSYGYWHWYHNAKSLAAGLDVPDHPNLRGRFVCEKESKFVDGAWMKCAMIFQSLAVEEGFQVDTESMAQELDARGTIKITVQRGAAETAAKRTSWKAESEEDVKASSKDVVLKHHVSHVIKHVPLEKSKGESRHHTWKPQAGPAGDTIKVTIRYRARDALQSLQIIPEDEQDEHQDRQDVKVPPSPHSEPRMPATRVKKEAKDDDDDLQLVSVRTTSSLPSRAGKVEEKPPTPAPTDLKRKREELEEQLREVEIDRRELALKRQLRALDMVPQQNVKQER